MRKNQHYLIPIESCFYGTNYCKQEKFKRYKQLFSFLFLVLFAFQLNAQNEFCGILDPNADGVCTVEEYPMDCAGDCLQGGQKNCDSKTTFCATVTLDLTCLGDKPCPDATVQSGVFQGCGNSSTANIALYLGGTCTESEGLIDLGAPTGGSLTFITCSSSATQSFSGFSWVCPPCELTVADCDDDDCTTTDSVNEEDCECVNTPITPPTCNDNDCTTMDTYDTDICECVYTPITPPVCDDNDCTTADTYDTDICECVYTPITPPVCDDNDCTTADTYDTDICECVYTPITPPVCNDNDCTTADTYDTDICECVYTPIATPNCDDNDCTTTDSYNTDICECVNTPIPTPNCDDNDCTTADTYDTDICECVYTPIATPNCNDNDCTTTDSYNTDICECVNTPIPTPNCDDNDCTTADSYDTDICECVNTPIANPSCDDGDCLTKDYYDTDICDCVNEPLPTPICDPYCEVFDRSTCECVTVIVPGAACNDGSACTINDKYDENCDCRGERVGFPGDACDDGDECTINDTLNEDCQCVGEPGPDSDKDGILDCVDPCPYDIDGMVHADLKCGIEISSNNSIGKSHLYEYGECTENCLSTGRELVYRFNHTSQGDLVVTFKEDAHPQLKRLNMFIITDPCTPSDCMVKYSINAPLMADQDPEKVVLKDAEPGIYYIIVDGHLPQATNDFTLLVECTGGTIESCPEDAYYFESFEEYNLGQSITKLLPDVWKTRGNSSSSALISNDQASNYDQSLEFNRFEGGAQDIDLDLGEKTKGTHRISWDMFIHPMGSAHFGIFGGDNSDPWGTIGHSFRMMSTKYQGRWFNVEIYVDIDKNKYAIYMDNRHFKETGKYYLNLHQLNLYSPPGGHFYVDNICYGEVESIPSVGADSETSDDRRQDNGFTDDLTLFPNPATDEVLLDLRKYAGKEVDLVIYNAMSFEVYRKHIPQVGKDAERISLNNFTNGLYIVNVKGKGIRAKAKKLIVSRMY